MATVLIVEDQEQILTLAQPFLEEQGHKTLSAATADEALAILTGSDALRRFCGLGYGSTLADRHAEKRIASLKHATSTFADASYNSATADRV
jgi:CheY-like chemotaxis protein